MATPLHSSKLPNSKYSNWIKAGLGVKYTKEGIAPFVYDEIEQFQQKCLSDICNNNGLAVGAACSSCFTENLVVCPTNRICNVHRGTCKYHKITALQYLPSGCPNKICHNFKNEIQNAHRYFGPAYRNTNAKLWCSDPWEVAKCFMPPDGYANTNSAAETDFDGIICVLISYKAFQSKVKDDLSKAKNIFEQAREVAKAVRHSPQLEIEDTDLHQYFTVFQDLLSDPAYLSTNKDAQDAKLKLLQLQNGTLDIGKDGLLANKDVEYNKFKEEQESHGSGRNVKNVEPSPDDYEQLEQIFSSRKDKSERKCTHEGRLLTLEPRTMKTILRFCRNRIEGAFGEVFISEVEVPGLDIKVAVKKIEARLDMNHKLRSMTNEKLASRTMHFAIVPILANCIEKNENTITSYFLSPYFEKGDLFELIESDTAALEKDQLVKLNKDKRMKIMHHVSSAVEFLHRNIPELRGPIIHLDVKSKNIVLDQFYNARLTDFGVSREIAKDENFIKTSTTLIPETDGYFKIGRTDTLEKYFDYVNVGIVIRELVSGLPPIFSENSYLKDKAKINYLKNIENLKAFKRKAMKIWTTEDVESFFELSNQCINHRSISAGDIVIEIEKILRSRGTAKWDRANESLNCEMCIINPSVEVNLVSHGMSCTCPLRVCVSCMRNEYLNPVLCHSCGKSTTVIDSANWGAILIAGVDKEKADKDKANADYSNVFLKDIEDIRDVIISKFPLVIGMRRENVKVMTMIQTSPIETTGKLEPTIRKAFAELKNSSVHTLFIYFSGHYSEENGFLVGYGNEHLQKEELKKMIEFFSEKEIKNKTVTSSVRFIVMLDCCAAPGIASASLNLNVNTSVVQFNACRSNEKAFVVKDGSIFKRFFVQGLTSKATKKPCYIRQLERKEIDKKDNDCPICPIRGEDFVTVENLHSYIDDHLAKINEVNYSGCGVPVIESKNFTSKDAILGYLFDSNVNMQFMLRYGKEGDDASFEIPHQFNRDMSQLRTLLFSKYMEKLDVTLMAEDLKDICCIEIELGPKTKHKREVKTIEQLNSAWNAKREIVVSLRDISMIRHGMVGRFIETEKMKKYLFETYTPVTNEKRNLTEVFLTCEQLEEVLENEVLKSCCKLFQTLEALSDAIDFHQNLIQKSQSTTFGQESGDTLTKKKVSGLHILFPCTKDGSHRPDFVCFELVYDGSDVSQDEQQICSERSSGTSAGNDNNLAKADSQGQMELNKE